MLIVDMSAVKLPGEAKQNNLPPECGQLLDAGASAEAIHSGGSEVDCLNLQLLIEWSRSWKIWNAMCHLHESMSRYSIMSHIMHHLK
jgi:hypothetical protein